MKYNLGSGKHTHEGWVNIDRVSLPGVNAVMDLFRFPWNLPSDSGDEFELHHIVEHIPHQIQFNPRDPHATFRWEVDEQTWIQRWQELRDLDGFFAFFAEIWRIAKPNARLDVIVPYGFTRGAFQDPTHTRYIVESSFAYLTQQTRDSQDFDYRVPCLYTIEHLSLEMPAEMIGRENEFQALLTHSINATQNMRVILQVVK